MTLIKPISNIKKDIRPTNDKRQPHGYWEVYYDGGLSFKCTYHNGKEVGYEEYYDSDGKLTEKKYYI